MDSIDQTDEQLLRGVMSSDKQAFKSLFEKYQPILFKHTFFRVRDADLAHDIVQETFLRVWERRTSLKPRLSFLSYLFRISANLLIDHVRHLNVRLKHNEILESPSLSGAEDPENAYRQRA